MKNLFTKCIVSAGLAVVGVLSVLSVSTAQQQVIGVLPSLDNPPHFDSNKSVFPDAAFVDARAKFISAAFIMIEHERFDVRKFMQLAGTDMSITRQAFVHVSGLPGETMFLTCGIERKGRLKSKHDRHKVLRDCDGSERVHPKHILSGHSAGSEIWLTDDLLPDSSGYSSSSIAIEVTYM